VPAPCNPFREHVGVKVTLTVAGLLSSWLTSAFTRAQEICFALILPADSALQALLVVIQLVHQPGTHVGRNPGLVWAGPEAVAFRFDCLVKKASHCRNRDSSLSPGKAATCFDCAGFNTVRVEEHGPCYAALRLFYRQCLALQGFDIARCAAL
jgi:hypothetical protein